MPARPMNPRPELEAIWREFAAPLRGFVLRRVASDHDADDIVQQIFQRIQTRLPSLRETDKLQGWLYRVARNAIVDHYRQQRPHDPLPDTLAADDPSDHRQAAMELARCLRGMIERLGPRYRDAVRWSELDGLPQRAVAARLGLSVSGAKSRVQRGRAALKKMLLACCRVEADRYGNILNSECRTAGGCGS